MPQIDIKLNTSADTSGFARVEQALGSLGARLQSFSQSLVTGLGVEVMARTVGALESTLKGAFDASFGLAEEIHKSAKALGVSAEAYQVLALVMKKAGGDADQLAKAVAKSNVALFEARDVGSKAAGAFRALGLSVGEFERLSFEQRAERIGRAVNESTDKTAAFAAASELLGTRGLPVTLAALQALARDGYDALAKSMREAGKIMGDETVDRLHEAEKAIAGFKKSVTIGVGETVGAAMAVGEALTKNKGATLIGMLKAFFLGPAGLGDLAAAVAMNTAPGTKPGGPDTSVADRLREQAAAIADAEQKIAFVRLDIKKTESNAMLSEFQKKDTLAGLLLREINLRNTLLEVTKAADLLENETEATKALKIAKQQQEIDTLGMQRMRLVTQSDRDDRRRSTNEGFSKFNDEGGVGGGGGGLGFVDGAKNWVVKMGSMASQVANAIENTIGGAVAGITDGIMGWIEGTKTFGQMLTGLGSMILRTMLQTIIQMGVQWLINSALIKMGMLSIETTGDTLRAARVVKENAAEAATLPAKTAGAAAAGISSFGVALTFGAIAIALIAALSGGFADGGFTSPGSKNTPAGIVHAGEWVAPQWMVKHPGFGQIIAGLEGARNGMPGFDVGGFTSPGRSLTRPGYVSPAASTSRHYFLIVRKEWSRMMQEDSEGFFHEVAAREMRRNA